MGVAYLASGTPVSNGCDRTPRTPTTLRTTLHSAALLLACSGLGQADAASSAEAHARPRLIAAVLHVPPGEVFDLAVTFEIDPHWHLYWPGRNDSGFPPEIDLTLPSGYKAGTPVWPAPFRLKQPGDVLDHVYEKRLTVILPITAPKDAAVVADFTADLNWLVCKDVCLPEKARVTLKLPVATPGEPARPSADKPLFDAAKAQVPKPIQEAAGSVRASLEDGRLVVTAPGASWVAFYPAQDSADTPDLLNQGEAKADRLSVTLGEGDKVAGVVAVRVKDAPARHYWIDLPVGMTPGTPGKSEK
jgi:DsbC/DsbD-like thiol-disulfide interchange protein